jgi:hypothetical protein
MQNVYIKTFIYIEFEVFLGFNTKRFFRFKMKPVFQVLS